jgi:hypothetical protein
LSCGFTRNATAAYPCRRKCPSLPLSIFVSLSSLSLSLSLSLTDGWAKEPSPSSHSLLTGLFWVRGSNPSLLPFFFLFFLSSSNSLSLSRFLSPFHQVNSNCLNLNQMPTKNVLYWLALGCSYGDEFAFQGSSNDSN